MGRSNRATAGALLAVAAAALAVRLAFLGARPAHWDEARLGFWILRYAETGRWTYHPILHGPFLFHADRLLLSVLAPTDASVRLVVAAVGGLLPLLAWFFRGHLDGAEVVALACLLAASPLLLFYSRYLRSDVPVAAFALLALGLLVRAREVGRGRHVVAAGAALGLAFAAKENAVLYLGTWLGAALLVAAWRRPSPSAVVVDGIRETPRRLRAWWRPLLAAAVVWLAVVVLAYAPRGGPVSLGAALAAPHRLPALVRAATIGVADRFVDVWLLGGHQSLGPRAAFYFLHLVAVLLVGAAPICCLAAVGIAREYRASRPRPLVAFAAAWAGLSLVGYPLAADLPAPWLAVHVAVPLAIPAAVGLRVVYERARAADGASRRRLARLGLALLVVHVAVVGAATSYAAPAHRFNPLAQPAQPSDDLRATVERIAACDGAAVLYYGEYFRRGTIPRRLPMAWYFARANVPRQFVNDIEGFPADPPAAVVALDVRRSVLDPRLEGYRAVEHELDPWVPREPYPIFTEAVFYLDASRLDACA